MRLALLLLLGTCAGTFAAGSKEAELPRWVERTGAQIVPQGTDVFKVADYGAVNDGKTLATKAIQAAIDACAAKGGGIVTFEPGAYLTGSIFVKAGVTLHLDKDVTILGSQDLADYPQIDTRVAGIEMRWPAALINVLDQDDVAITGAGTVHAQGWRFDNVSIETGDNRSFDLRNCIDMNLEWTGGIRS